MENAGKKNIESREQGISAILTELAGRQFHLKEITPAQYASMKYPKILPMMRFCVHQYEMEGFGNLMTMDTKAMGGMMKLSTIVLTPNSGKQVPFLLIDTMEMKKKSLAYVEYYDCTRAGAKMPGAEKQPEEFAHIADYAEKPAWYVERRTPYSLIKGGENVSSQELQKMVVTCAKRYLDAAQEAEVTPENLTGLKAFQQDMCTLGNPSTDTMTKVLGGDGARIFFEQVIMPVEV